MDPNMDTNPIKQEGEKRKIRFRQVLAVILALLFVCGVGILSFNSCRKAFQDATGVTDTVGGRDLQADFARYVELYTIISQNYNGEMDADKMFEQALMQYVAALGDRYSQYMTKEEGDVFIDGDYGKKSGIGIRTFSHADMPGINVYYVFPYSPAEKAGLKKGDAIVAVDGVAVTVESYDQCVNAISGEENTVVKLSVKRDGAIIDYNVVRGKYVIKSIEYSLLETAPDVGYIRIVSLAKETPDLFKEAILDLQKQGAKSYIFDVRDDPGGYLDAIKEILDMLLPEGPIIRYEAADGTVKTESSDADQLIKAPMAVLINGKTASAAELFAAALKDYNLATLVGETTFGKGVMQTIFTLKNGDRVKITTSKYSPPFSDNYDGIGVAPHTSVALPEGKKYYMLSEDEDTQLQAALTALEAKGKQD